MWSPDSGSCGKNIAIAPLLSYFFRRSILRQAKATQQLVKGEQRTTFCTFHHKFFIRILIYLRNILYLTCPLKLFLNQKMTSLILYVDATLTPIWTTFHTKYLVRKFNIQFIATTLNKQSIDARCSKECTTQQKDVMCFFVV